MTSDATSFCSFASSSACCCASLDVALAAAALVAFELLLRLAQLDRAPGCACAPPSFDPFAAACRIASAASCSCCAASRELLPLLLVARQLLELPRRLLGFLGERALRRARRRRRSGLTAPCRRCRSASCCCRRASSFSFSAS